MITKEMCFNKAFEEKRERVKKREFDRSVMVAAAYTAEPELTAIDRKLKANGAAIALTALSGDSKKLKSLKNESQALSAQKSALLKKAGVKPESFECDICRDTGYVSGKICECIRRDAARIAAETLSSEIPVGKYRFDNFDLDYYPDKAENGISPKKRMSSVLKLCREYAEGFSPETSENLLFMGGVGLGKTHLTMAIVGEVISKGYLPVYGSAENLFSAVESEKFSGEKNGQYEGMLGCDLLVIDDLGAEMATSFTKSVLYNLINTRILSGKPTVINTNLTMKEIEERYTARISSRLIGEYNANKFLGADIRQQKLIKQKG